VERMTWRLEINHVTRYDYDRPVVASYNEARVTPLSVPGQLVIDAQVAVRPVAEVYCYQDYWGAIVHCFDLHDPHDSLVVTARATVDTGLAETGHDGAQGPGGLAGGGPASDGRGPPGASWDLLGRAEVRDRFYEFLAPSRLVSVEQLTDVAEHLLSPGPSPDEAVRAALEWANGELEYVAGATHVHTSAVEAWRDGRGVCQDFAHLSLAVMRAMGIPARYVSGYFYPKASGEVGAKVLGESHAWIEAWTGGWTGHDPTNLLPVAERYVVVARGRDYADVAPLRGIYSGPPGSTSEVTVELTRRA
jgi:transglutaminase-like putative cysteine protease